MTHITIRKLSIAALLAALCIIFTRFFSIPIGLSIRIGFGKLPVMLAGILLGPWWGAAVGAMADLLGYFVNPMGEFYIPGITISMALVGLIPGVITWYLFKKQSIAAVLVSSIANAILVGCILTPVWLIMAYGEMTFWGILPGRALNELAMIPVNTILAWAIIKAWEASPLRRMPSPSAIK